MILIYLTRFELVTAMKTEIPESQILKKWCQEINRIVFLHFSVKVKILIELCFAFPCKINTCQHVSTLRWFQWDVCDLFRNIWIVQRPKYH